MQKTCFCGCASDAEVGGGDEREEHNQAEESKCEEEIDSERSDKEYEGCDGPRKFSVETWRRRRKTTYIETLWKPWELL
jgi:hypothetical protein